MKIIDIILLSNAQTEPLRQLTENAINSLLDSEDPAKIRFNVLVIESAQTRPYPFPCCQTIFPKQVFGYHKFMNLGLRQTQAPLVCLCNNDLIFHPGWASAILRAFDADPELKSASPFCSFNHPERGFFADSGIHYGYEVRDHLSGWCIFLKREILAVTGPLEERLRFWYSDNDYAKTLEKHGIQHALVTSSKVDHLESQTLKTKSERERLQLTGDERYFFEYKWGSRSYFSYLNHKRKQLFKK
ncbi:glycosyltransferase [Algoriphagus sp.]|uniref:glycosyltransferase family 2 protein n=1 Tax=Algoriphagus sp. TaxID=1872435 RepID=UPI002612B859|nr:glycosyltransferase [Algoriphagus sp.]